MPLLAPTWHSKASFTAAFGAVRDLGLECGEESRNPPEGPGLAALCGFLPLQLLQRLQWLKVSYS